MKRFGYFLFFLIGLSLTGHGFELVKSASSADDAKAKQFAPDPNAALVYAFRDNSFTGQHLVSRLVVNKRVVAENGRNEFSVVTMKPGEYDLECAAGQESNAGVSFLHNLKKMPVHLTAEAGKVYFVQEVFKAVGGFSLKPVSQKEAEPIIKKGKLKETVRY
jgi:hypothetical protein